MPRALVLASVLLCAAAPARAQRCDADIETCARRAYEGGNFALALARFRAMLAEAPTPPLRLAIAQCLFQLGRFEQALEELDAIPADASVSAQAEALRELVEAGLGRSPEPAAAASDAPAASRARDGPSAGEAAEADTADASIEAPHVDRSGAAPSDAEVGYAPSWLFWTGLATSAVGAAFAVVGGVAVLDASRDWDAARCFDGLAFCDAIRDRYELAAPFATTGFVLGGVGLGLLLLELILETAGEPR